MGIARLDLEKISHATLHRRETWAARKNLAGSAIGSKKSSPMKKLSVGELRWDLEKISKAAMYRSEDIGAGKQSAGRRVGKNFRPRWRIKSIAAQISYGISTAGLRKNF